MAANQLLNVSVDLRRREFLRAGAARSSSRFVLRRRALIHPGDEDDRKHKASVSLREANLKPCGSHARSVTCDGHGFAGTLILASQGAVLVGLYLGTALLKVRVGVKALVYDHNCDCPDGSA